MYGSVVCIVSVAPSGVLTVEVSCIDSRMLVLRKMCEGHARRILHVYCRCSVDKRSNPFWRIAAERSCDDSMGTSDRAYVTKLCFG